MWLVAVCSCAHNESKVPELLPQVRERHHIVIALANQTLLLLSEKQFNDSLDTHPHPANKRTMARKATHTNYNKYMLLFES